MHDEYIGKMPVRQEESLRNGADDGESEALPQSYGARIRGDDEVELHGGEAAMLRAAGAVMNPAFAICAPPPRWLARR